MKCSEIRKEIYKLGQVNTSKQFRKLFPEFDSYSLQLKCDLRAILGCLKAEPEAVAAVIALGLSLPNKVTSLPDYKFNKQLTACQDSEDYVEMMANLTQEIVNDTKHYAQHFRSKKL